MPKLDDAVYSELAKLLRERVAAHAPDWIDNNESDPGISLLEVFAFLTETLLYRANAIPERGRSSAAHLAKSALALTKENADAAIDTLERLRYFPGQSLGVDDFQLEQDYFRERLRRHNRALHGFGVVHGLGVSMRHEGDAGELVVVEPGFAIDPYGEEIEVPRAAAARLPEHGPVVYVTLLHTERPTHPRPTVDGLEPQFTRIEEGFAIRLEAVATSNAVQLARLLNANGSWRIDEAFRPARERGSNC